jgi:hypothetical protein
MLNNFLKQIPQTIVFFADEESDLDFGEFTIKTFRTSVVFLRAGPGIGASFGCKTFPCVVAFKNDKPLPFESPPLTAFGFLDWVSRVTASNVIPLTAPESLRKLFEGPQPALIGVDLTSRPTNLTNNKPFYTVNSSLLEVFGVSVPTGIYLYRPADRELVHYNGDYVKLSDAGISTASEIDTRSKRLFAGFSINTSTELYSQTEISLLKQLQAKYRNALQFANLHGTSAATYEAAAQLEAVPKPYFFVLNASDLSGGRYIIYNDPERLHSFSALSAFIDRIVAGEEPFTTVSEPVLPDDLSNPLKRLVGTSVEQFVLNGERDVLLGVTGPSLHTQVLLAVLNETAHLLAGIESLEIGVINGPTNDLPECVPAITTYPALFLWPAGRKESPLTYQGPRKVGSVIEFLTNGTGVAFQVPEYNAGEVDGRIMNAMRRSRATRGRTSEPNR